MSTPERAGSEPRATPGTQELRLARAEALVLLAFHLDPITIVEDGHGPTPEAVEVHQAPLGAPDLPWWAGVVNTETVTGRGVRRGQSEYLVYQDGATYIRECATGRWLLLGR